MPYSRLIYEDPLRWDESEATFCTDNLADYMDPTDPYEIIPLIILQVCDGGAPRTGPFTGRPLSTHYISVGDLDDPEREYDHEMWDWYNNPWVYALPPLTDASLYDFSYGIESRNLALAKLQDYVNRIRQTYSLRLVEPGKVYQEWNSGALNGGEVYYETVDGNRRLYYARIDIDADRNTIAPSRDTERVRFHTFDQGPMHVPRATFIVQRVISDEFETLPHDLTQVYIAPEINRLYIQPIDSDDNSIYDIQQHTLFYIKAANDYPLLIAKANDFARYGATLSIHYDPQWEAGDFVDGMAVEIGFAI